MFSVPANLNTHRLTVVTASASALRGDVILGRHRDRAPEDRPGPRHGERSRLQLLLSDYWQLVLSTYCDSNLSKLHFGCSNLAVPVYLRVF